MGRPTNKVRTPMSSSIGYRFTLAITVALIAFFASCGSDDGDVVGPELPIVETDFA